MTKENVLLLVKAVKNGDQEAFRELEGVSKPLLVSLARRFSTYHYKFEFDDFYSICLLGLYQACEKFNEENPSFLDFAKLFMMRACWREVEHWNQEKRNIFRVSEVSYDTEYDKLSEAMYGDNLFDIALANEFRGHVSQILDECFDDMRSDILRKYFLQDERVCDIAESANLNYKRVHTIIERGAKKLEREYASRYM